jgi:sulfur-carrier protein
LDNDATIGSVYEVLVQSNSKFTDWKTVLRFAVNHEYVDNDCILHNGDEVAVIPPVSGG